MGDEYSIERIRNEYSDARMNVIGYAVALLITGSFALSLISFFLTSLFLRGLSSIDFYNLVGTIVWSSPGFISFYYLRKHRLRYEKWGTLLEKYNGTKENEDIKDIKQENDDDREACEDDPEKMLIKKKKRKNENNIYLMNSAWWNSIAYLIIGCITAIYSAAFFNYRYFTFLTFINPYRYHPSYTLFSGWFFVIAIVSFILCYNESEKYKELKLQI